MLNLIIRLTTSRKASPLALVLSTLRHSYALRAVWAHTMLSPFFSHLSTWEAQHWKEVEWVGTIALVEASLGQLSKLEQRPL